MHADIGGSLNRIPASHVRFASKQVLRARKRLARETLYRSDSLDRHLATVIVLQAILRSTALICLIDVVANIRAEYILFRIIAV